MANDVNRWGRFLLPTPQETQFVSATADSSVHYFTEEQRDRLRKEIQNCLWENLEKIVTWYYDKLVKDKELLATSDKINIQFGNVVLGSVDCKKIFLSEEEKEKESSETAKLILEKYIDNE